MRIINGGRQVGKTYKLIEHAAETGNIILVHNKRRANIIKQQADLMNKKVKVYSVEELNRPELFRGTELHYDLIKGKVKIDIDDMEEVIQCYVPFTIDMVACNIPETPEIFIDNQDNFRTEILGIPYTSDK